MATKKKVVVKAPAKPTGRPSEYKPEYCELLLKHMDEGLSYESFAGLVGVSRETLYNWEEAHSEFFDTKKKSVEKSRLWWEREGVTAMRGKDPGYRNFNATIWLFNMKNRFKWHDNVQVSQDVKVEQVNNSEKLAKELTEILKTKAEIK